MIQDKIRLALKDNPARFCMPGHKGRGVFLDIADDVTELPFSDDLHQPSGCIADAQKTVAKLFGAKETFFLVGGSTLGIQTMIRSALKKGDKLALTRDCHISVINSLVLFGIEPVFIESEFNTKFGVYNAVTPQDIHDVIREDERIKGVLVTSPSYYGVCADVAGIADVVHKANAVLLWDEAHGAHLGFCDDLPKSAVVCGADAVVQSAHKTLPAMTQTALLHNSGLESQKIRDALRILQTSSPSYILMESLERACLEIDNRRDELPTLIGYCDEIRKRATDTGRFQPLYSEDKARIILRYNGEQNLMDQFIEKGVIPELAEYGLIVFITSINNTEEDFQKLSKALVIVAEEIELGESGNKEPLPPLDMRMTPQEAYEAKTCWVKKNSAEGRVSARVYYKYPPAIPILCPGAVITQEIVGLIKDDMIQVVK